MTPQEAYAALEARFLRIRRLSDAMSILHWDMETMMPTGAAPGRGEQLATLSVVVHEHLTGEDMAGLLDRAAEAELGEWERSNIREMRRSWVHAAAVPADLVEAHSKATSACNMTWREARKADDYDRLVPALDEVLRLTREKASLVADALGVSPYEALMDQFEPGARQARVDALFDELAGFLPELTEQVLDAQNRRPAILEPSGPFAVEQQRALGVQLMKTLGFDFERGRLDVSSHPFCGGTATDVRITTRYDEGDFTSALMGVVHETGHALYEQGRPEAWRDHPVGEALGMSLHESQSLLMEMQACRSREFLQFAAPHMRAAFGAATDDPAYTAENLFRLYTRVKRSLIRVDADEVTYPAHVILRYRLEKALLSGDLSLKDLPGAWRDGMKSLVGIEPPNDADGCMQDIHWMEGAFGYFPTYTLGAMTAAQLFAAATEANADILPGIAKGDFTPLVTWLRANVHEWGSHLDSDALLTRATGKPLDVQVFRRHLEQRYLQAA